MRRCRVAFGLLPFLALLPVNADGPAKVGLPAKNFTETIPGSGVKIEGLEKVPDVKFEMVYIPAGEFMMGSPESEPGRNADEGPQHKVKIKAFWIGKCEVSWDEFDMWWKNEQLKIFPKDPPFPKVADAITRPTNPYVPEDYDFTKEGRPAICMSHHAAMMYCHWLRTVTNKNYRLPSEAEWEYACRAGSKTAYSFGDDPAKLGEYAWMLGNSKDEDLGKEKATQKVGTKKPNAFGLYDMHGNVWEYCLDLYDAKFYDKCVKEKLELNPVNLPKDKKWGHVVRGGSFRDEADKLRSAARWHSEIKWMYEDPQDPRSIWWLTRYSQIGFRVCLPVEEYAELKDIKPSVIKLSEHDEPREGK